MMSAPNFLNFHLNTKKNAQIRYEIPWKKEKIKKEEKGRLGIPRLRSNCASEGPNSSPSGEASITCPNSSKLMGVASVAFSFITFSLEFSMERRSSTREREKALGFGFFPPNPEQEINGAGQVTANGNGRGDGRGFVERPNMDWSGDKI